ncbi:MAG: hypothetical protein PHW13_12690 [Methylococcales bacterium]|nr:hypothetical protein [Methylococcales bacterium]
MHNHIARLVFIFFILCNANAVLAEDAVDIKFADLPDAVKTTALQTVEMSRISKVTRISDNQTVKFRIETDKVENSKNFIYRVVVMADNGKIMKLTQEVPYFTLSYPQMQAIEKRYPGIKVKELESVETRHYHVLAEVNGQPLKFRFYDNGAIEETDDGQ